MSLRDKLRNLFFSIGGWGAVDHPANGGITGEQSPEEAPEAGEGSEQ